LAYRAFNVTVAQMLAYGNDDLLAAIDENGSAAALEPRTNGYLNNRDGEQRNEKDDQRSHMIDPSRLDVRAEITINRINKIRFRPTLQKCIPSEKSILGFPLRAWICAGQDSRPTIAALHTNRAAPFERKSPAARAAPLSDPSDSRILAWHVRIGVQVFDHKTSQDACPEASSGGRIANFRRKVG
jgi:hypothetical protein